MYVSYYFCIYTLQTKSEEGYNLFVQVPPHQQLYSDHMSTVGTEPLKSGECNYEAVVTPNSSTDQQCINYQSMYGLPTPEMTPSANGGSPSFFWRDGKSQPQAWKVMDMSSGTEKFEYQFNSMFPSPVLWLAWKLNCCSYLAFVTYISNGTSYERNSI